MILVLKLDLWKRVGSVARAGIYTGTPVAFVLNLVLNNQHSFCVFLAGRVEPFHSDSHQCLRLPLSR